MEVYVSVGSNVEPARHLRFACAELTARFGTLRRSSVYRSAPVGFEGDDFLNMVVSFETADSATSIVANLDILHDQAGRVRGADPFSARTLDLDLLLYGDQVIDDAAVRVPREDITRYAFVLAPLAELAPELRHPITGEPIGALWARFDQATQPRVERLPEFSL